MRLWVCLTVVAMLVVTISFAQTDWRQVGLDAWRNAYTPSYSPQSQYSAPYEAYSYSPRLYAPYSYTPYPRSQISTWQSGGFTFSQGLIGGLPYSYTQHQSGRFTFGQGTMGAERFRTTTHASGSFTFTDIDFW